MTPSIWSIWRRYERSILTWVVCKLCKKQKVIYKLPAVNDSYSVLSARVRIRTTVKNGFVSL